MRLDQYIDQLDRQAQAAYLRFVALQDLVTGPGRFTTKPKTMDRRRNQYERAKAEWQALQARRDHVLAQVA